MNSKRTQYHEEDYRYQNPSELGKLKAPQYTMITTIIRLLNHFTKIATNYEEFISSYRRIRHEFQRLAHIWDRVCQFFQVLHLTLGSTNKPGNRAYVAWIILLFF